MAAVKKKRGRPKSEATLKRERAENQLKNKPSWIVDTPERQKKRGELKQWIKEDDQREKQFLKAHNSPPMPANLVLAMASIGDESLVGYEQHIIELHGAVSKTVRYGQASGGKTIGDRAKARKRELLKKNWTLVAKIGTPPWTASRIAKIIHKEWEAILPAGRMLGEPSTLNCRGDGQKKPALRTLRDWLRSKNIT